MSDENFEQLLENFKKLESDMKYIDDLTNEYYFANPSEPTKYKVKSLLTELKYFRKNNENMVEYIEKLCENHKEEISRLYDKNNKLDFRNRMKIKELKEEIESLHEQLAHFMGDME